MPTRGEGNLPGKEPRSGQEGAHSQGSERESGAFTGDLDRPELLIRLSILRSDISIRPHQKGTYTDYMGPGRCNQEVLLTAL